MWCVRDVMARQRAKNQTIKWGTQSIKNEGILSNILKYTSELVKALPRFNSVVKLSSVRMLQPDIVPADCLADKIFRASQDYAIDPAQ